MSDEDIRDGAVERLVRAMNAHDIEGIVACFADDYTLDAPLHPARSFRGREQVRRNWTQILGAVPDLAVRLLRVAADGATAWTEWEMSGTRPDGASLVMRGVVIFGIGGEVIRSARFYLEPVEETSGDVDVHTRRVVGAAGDRAGNEQQ